MNSRELFQPTCWDIEAIEPWPAPAAPEPVMVRRFENAAHGVAFFHWDGNRYAAYRTDTGDVELDRDGDDLYLFKVAGTDFDPYVDKHAEWDYARLGKLVAALPA